MIEGLQTRGHRHVLPLESPEELPPLVASVATSGDLVVCLGAGTITNWANDLPDALRALHNDSARTG